MRIALLGFKPRERVAFEAFFRLAGRRTPAYALVLDVKQAEIVIVDADDEAQCVRVAKLAAAQRVAAVGARPLPGAVVQTARPLNVLRVISAIDRLQGHGAGASSPALAAVPAGSSTAPTAPAVADLHAPARRPAALPVSTPAAAPGPGRAGTAAQAAPMRVAAAASGREVGTRDHEAASRRHVGTRDRESAKPPIAHAPTAPAAASMPDDVPSTLPMPLSQDMAPTVPMALDELPPAASRAPDPLLPLLAPHERITLIGLDDEAPPAGATPQAGERRAEPVEQPTHRAAPPRRLKHVLVVDTGDDALRFLVATLEPLGFSVRLARDGTEAIDCVRARRFHFAFVRVDAERREDAASLQPLRLVTQMRLAARDAGREAPTVAVFGTPQSLVGALSRRRQGLVDIEAALALPLQRDEVLEAVGARSLPRQSFAPTAPHTTYS